MAAAVFSEQNIPQLVTEAYGAKAKLGVTSAYANGVAEAFGYTKEQLESIPIESNMGLSCGNPVASATIKQGEVVVDLGSGGGIDIFLAAEKVGPTGRAIGLDGSADMIALARRNAAKRSLKPPQVSFVHTLLTDKLPIKSESVDCILSNCVVNLLPPTGKADLMKETYRILKPGGRIVLDDIIAKVPLPDEIRNDMGAYVGCISGAIQVEEYRKLLADAGFNPNDILFVDTRSDINVYHTADNAGTANGVGCCARPSASCGQAASSTATNSCTPKKAYTSVVEDPSFDANKWVASYQIYVKKAVVGTPFTPQNAVDAEPDVLERWWDPYPVAKSTPPQLTPEELADLIRSSPLSETNPHSEYAVIDVRRPSRRTGGRIRGSHQLAADILPTKLQELFETYKNTKKVIFHCNGSSSALRCAGWYQDYLNDAKIPHEDSQAYILQGGFEGWLAKYGKETDLVDSI